MTNISREWQRKSEKGCIYEKETRLANTQKWRCALKFSSNRIEVAQFWGFFGRYSNTLIEKKKKRYDMRSYNTLHKRISYSLKGYKTFFDLDFEQSVYTAAISFSLPL